MNVEQRSVNRITTAPLTTGGTVTNVASATVDVPGQSPVTKDDAASYTVTSITVGVAVDKTIAPARIPA
ncbi:hypothetical protein, partial [Proteus mirabilis]|uniref:hypothetical protein n=1 Tax=Proteus mirabilis TaxID=584 RepID=UPI0013D6EA1E